MTMTEETPMTNDQGPTKAGHRRPTGLALVIENWTLVIDWSLIIGHWSLVRSGPSATRA